MARKRPMPKFTPAPEALVRRFTDAVGAMRGVESRKMFSYPAAFVHGNMFSGLFQDAMILKLPEADRRSLAERGGRPFEPMPGRVMGEFVVVPPALLADPGELASWLGRARMYVATLPPKVKTPKSAKRPTPKKKRSRR